MSKVNSSILGFSAEAEATGGMVIQTKHTNYSTGGMVIQTKHSNYSTRGSVSDPYHFDPDPRIRIRDDGSGSEVTFDSVNRIFPIKCYARL